MLISHRYRFIFIHVQKTGGTSISRALEPYCEHTLGELKQLGYPAHAPAAGIRRLAGSEIWDSYFKFAFERNPWDRTLSGYYYQLQNPAQFRKFYWSGRPSFDHWMFHWGIIPKRLAPSFDMYSIDDELAVDFVGRYERLVDDFAEVCRRIGLPEVALPLSNKSVLRSSHDYRSAYTRRTRNRVARIHHREIAHFGYAF